MTRNARTVLPTDLVALVSYDGRAYANQAMTRDRIGTEGSPHPLETAFEQWFSFATGRHTCVSVKGTTLRGLVSARKRGSKQAWEIDCLIDATDGDGGVVISLLDQITAATGRSGALKVFLRLRSGSELVDASARGGYLPYVRENLYRLDAGAAAAPVLPAGLRRRTKVDLYSIFQLYNGLVPQNVRQREGVTLGEWSAAQESLGRGTQYLLEREGRVSGWLRAAGDGDVGRFDLLGEAAAFDDLIGAGIAKVANRREIFALVPEYQEGAARGLEARGFELTEQYTVLYRRTVRPVRVPSKMQPVVRTTFG
jgi:hypothetical protein